MLVSVQIRHSGFTKHTDRTAVGHFLSQGDGELLDYRLIYDVTIYSQSLGLALRMA